MIVADFKVLYQHEEGFSITCFERGLLIVDSREDTVLMKGQENQTSRSCVLHIAWAGSATA